MQDVRTVDLSPELAAHVSSAAAWRGMSVEQYVREVVTAASRLDAELAADLSAADEDFAAGRVRTQAEVEAMFNVRRERRRAA